MKARRILSLVLAIGMILGVVPMGEIVAWATDGPAEITRINITKHISGINNKDDSYYSILIYGSNIKNIGVGIKAIDSTTGGNSIIPAKRNPEIENEFIAPASDEYESVIYITENKAVKASINVVLPDVDKIEPSGGIVDTSSWSSNKGVKVTLAEGINPEEVSLSQGNSSMNMGKVGETSTYSLDSKKLKDKSGSWGISIKRKDDKRTLDGNISHSEGTNIEIESKHNNVFSFRKELPVSDTISMSPTQGNKETEITLKAENLIKDISIFFVKRIGEEYTIENMVPNESIRHTPKQGTVKEDMIKFKVPPTLEELGSYHVVLVNRINPTKNINEQVNSQKIIESPKFILIEGKNGIKIDSITPKIGSINGIDAKIKGINLGRISKEIYTTTAIPDVSIENDNKTMVVKYSKGKYNGREVESVTRKVTIFIGNQARFIEDDYNFKSDIFDYIGISVPSKTDLEKLSEDVFVEIETEVKYEDGSEDNISENDTLKNGFTYTPLDYMPEITSIVPNKIPVDKDGKITHDFTISIIGKNFLKYRYFNDKGKIDFKLPKVEILEQVASDKWFKDIKIYDDNGNEINGTEGNDLGTRISITLTKGSEIPEGIYGREVDLKVTNPLKTNTDDVGSHALGKITFVNVGVDETPNVTSINPSIVTTAGQKNVIIKGDKFYPGVKVYIDGVEIKDIKRNDISDEIIFDAPPRKEGAVQIIVQNEKGGAYAFYPFTYVDAYTNPKITDFNPKKGTENTLVTLKGQSLVPPNPLVTDVDGIGIWKLIGTRVLLGGKDINEYNMSEGKTIPELKDYVGSDDKLISLESGGIKLSDYYHSIILEKEPKIDSEEVSEYYTVFADTKTGEIKLSNGDKEIYKIEAQGTDLIGKKDGKQFTIEVNSGSLIINKGKDDEKTLKFKTPYATKDNKIIGNRVKVINNNELVFNVPRKEPGGYYDVTIVNPDTNRDSKVGKAGFNYFLQLELKPKIEKINPKEGSIDGEYYITIFGENFKDGEGDDKVSVIIGTQVVNPKDVELSRDRKEIRVKVPKYPGDLSTETDTGRKTVAVGVVNPDGGSDSMEDGFTYIIPTSHPVIKNLILDKGSAAGRESVIVEGTGFRFFEPFRSSENDVEGEDPIDFTNLNKNDKWDDLRYWLSDQKKDKYDTLVEAGYEEFVLPILPKVYFGGKEAKIISFGEDYIEVETPGGENGNIEVYLVNNDHGISKKVNFKYEASNPKVTSITPGLGKKQGNDKVEILGEGFHESQVKVIGSDNKQLLQKIQFGNPKDPKISNRDITINAKENSGKINNGKSKVEVGDLTVEYELEKGKEKLNFKIIESEIEYNLNDVVYDGDEVFLPVNLLKNDKGESYKGYEYVRIVLETVPGAITTKRLRVDRGFAPKATLRNSGHINLNTPSYYTVGRVPVTLINPDGGTATTNFEYKNPDSEPTITNILRDREAGKKKTSPNGEEIIVLEVPDTGGNTIEIVGSDFRKPVKITIGNFDVKSEIEYYGKEGSGYNKLSFKMPAMGGNYLEKDLRVVVSNEDSGFASSEPIYIHITEPESTDLKITSVTPNVGPTTGGTTVTIDGKDFRETMKGKDGKIKIQFERGDEVVTISDSNIESISIDKIVLKTPAFTPGLVDIKIINPDGNFVSLKNSFRYISNPRINSVVDPDDDSKIEEISSEGGEKIKILGSDFSDKARVVFNPVLIPVEEGEEATGKVVVIGDKRYILKSGVDGIETEYIDDGTIVVTTPKGGMGDKGVMVINPDDGASNIYNLIYEISSPTITSVIDPNNENEIMKSISIDGGEEIKILGSDFREGAKVYFNPVLIQLEDGDQTRENVVVIQDKRYFLKDGVEGLNPEIIDRETIMVTTPKGSSGDGGILVVNLDQGASNVYNLNYEVSNPKITSIVNPEDEKFPVKTLSVKGGEKIQIIGKDFIGGARVIFNPQLKLVEDKGQDIGDIITIDGRDYILEDGETGTEVEVINGQTIIVTTPSGKLGDKGVLVRNPDNGASNIYSIVYGAPEIASPFGVRAELVLDQFIRVNWTGPKDAVEYEIQVSVEGGKFEFIGTTELRSYAVEKLKPNTKYRFLVKAMGKYGSSKPIDESKSNEVTTGKEVGPIDVQGKPAEKTEIRKNGTKADIIVGSKDFTSKGMIIDLTKGDLAAIKDISIRIPASVISDSTGKIQVLGKDYRMNFTPSVFKTSTIEANKSKSNAGVVFNIASHNDSMDLKAGESIVGGRYKLEAVTYVDKSLSKMDYINGSLNFILDQDPLIIKNRRLTNIKTVRYDDSSKTWVNINAENRLGLYTVIGSRR